MANTLESVNFDVVLARTGNRSGAESQCGKGAADSSAEHSRLTRREKEQEIPKRQMRATRLRCNKTENRLSRVIRLELKTGAQAVPRSFRRGCTPVCPVNGRWIRVLMTNADSAASSNISESVQVRK